MTRTNAKSRIRPVIGCFLSIAMYFAIGFSQSALWAQNRAMPKVERVDAQPLLVITNRLAEAMQSIGAPFTQEQIQTINVLKNEPSDAKITANIQRILDPLCVASIEIRADGETIVTPGETVDLAENGWRAMLVKVVNRAGVQSKLRVDSPNARPIPHGPKEDIDNRWLALSMFDGRPLNANLSGLELEYRIVQLSSTTVGNRKARLEFNAGIAGSANSSVIRQWRFDKDSDGWGELNDLKMVVRNQSLFLEATGDDPFISAPVTARGDGWYFASGAALTDRELDKSFGGPNSCHNPMVADKWYSNSTLVAIVNTLSSSLLKVI